MAHSWWWHVLLIFVFRFYLRDCWQSWLACCRAAFVSFSQLSHGQGPCMGSRTMLPLVISSTEEWSHLLQVWNPCDEFPLLYLFNFVVQYTSPKGNVGWRDQESLSCNVCPAFCGEQPRPLLFTAMYFVPEWWKDTMYLEVCRICPALQSLFVPLSLLHTHTHTHARARVGSIYGAPYVMTIHNQEGQMKKIKYSTHPSLQPHSVVRPKHSVCLFVCLFVYFR